jgi:hypothetical protein
VQHGPDGRRLRVVRVGDHVESRRVIPTHFNPLDLQRECAAARIRNVGEARLVSIEHAKAAAEQRAVAHGIG